MQYKMLIMLTGEKIKLLEKEMLIEFNDGYWKNLRMMVQDLYQ